MAEADEMDLTFEDATVGAWNVLSVAGELDMHTSAAMQERLDALSIGDSPKVAVDLSAVPFMDSSSLGILVSNFKRLQGARRRSGHRRGRRLATESPLHHGDRPRDPDLRRRDRSSPGLMALAGAASAQRSSLEIPLDSAHILTARLFAGWHVTIARAGRRDRRTPCS